MPISEDAGSQERTIHFSCYPPSSNQSERMETLGSTCCLARSWLGLPGFASCFFKKVTMKIKICLLLANLLAVTCLGYRILAVQSNPNGVRRTAATSEPERLRM